MLLFKILLGILVAIGGLVVLAVLVLVVAYIVLSVHVNRRMRGTLNDMQSLLPDGHDEADWSDLDGSYDLIDVPPFHIHLRRHSNELYQQDELCKRIDAWLVAHDFQRAGTYRIVELRERLCVYVSDDQLLLAAIRQQPDEAAVYVEFCFDLGDGRCGGVSNPPHATLEVPSDAVGKHFAGTLDEDFSLLSEMWLAAKELVDQHDVVPTPPDQIPAFYEAAHAAEMELRIHCGGLTEQEIRATLLAQGLEASQQDIEEVQEYWQFAIEEHLLDYSPRSTELADGVGSVLAVYDGSIRSFLLNRLIAFLDDVEGMEPSSLDALESDLRELLQNFSPREAVARFRPLLPAAARYRLIDQLHQPVEADLYLLDQPSLSVG